MIVALTAFINQKEIDIKSLILAECAFAIRSLRINIRY